MIVRAGKWIDLLINPALKRNDWVWIWTREAAQNISEILGYVPEIKLEVVDDCHEIDVIFKNEADAVLFQLAIDCFGEKR